MVRRHVQTAVEAVLELAPDSIAIYLSGGFGRGEGTVRRTASGWIPVNDYDLVVVSPVGSRRPDEAAHLGPRLAAQFGVDYVDIGWWTLETLQTAGPTLENYDFKRVAQLLHGAELRAEMPEIVAAQIPRFEYLRLLGNRAAGVLTTLRPERRNDEGYATVQKLKAWLAVGDVVVAMAGQHHPLCAARRDAFAGLARQVKAPGWMRPDMVENITAAYTAKQEGWVGDRHVSDVGLADALAGAFLWVAGMETGAHGDLRQVERALARHYAGSRSGVLWNIGRVMKHRRWVYLRGDRAALQRHVLFAQVTMYVAHQQGATVAGPAFWERFRWFPGVRRMPHDGEGAAQLWEEWVHG